MKKIFISLAAIAALASCVEEKGLDPQPQQPVGNQVTIKAVTADTKTVLSDGDVKDGVSVLWENNDSIKVVFTGTDAMYTSKFITSLEANSDEADFTGKLDPEVTVENCGNYGYAIYPYHKQIHPDSQHKIVLPVLTVQDGIVKAPTADFFRMELQDVIKDGQMVKVEQWYQQENANYSYATVSLDNINAGNSTEAYFRNVLSLIRVNVPSGVKKVTISSINTVENPEDEDKKNYSPLTGKARFQYNNYTRLMDMLVNEWNQQDKSYEVVLMNSNGSELDADKSYDLLVYPGTHAKLTIKVEGDEVSCTKTINKEYTFDPSECYTLDLREIFAMGSKEVYAFPDGKPFEIPVTTTFDDVTVGIPADASWLTVTPEAKGILRNDVISLTAAENTTGSVRSATVTLKSGTTILSTVEVTQKSYVKELINEYSETYGSTNGTLKIEVSDDQAKGVYKVTICGHTLYADYADGTLTVYDSNNERKLKVSDDYSTITAKGLSIQEVNNVDYSAVLQMGAAELTTEEEALLGYYDESWIYENSPYKVTQGMKIEKSDEAAFGQFIITCLTGKGSSFKGYAQKSGNEITLKLGKQHHSLFNTIGESRTNDLNPLVFNVNNDGTLSFSEWKDGYNNPVTEYKATKAGDIVEGDDSEDEPGTPSSPYAYLFGDYTESFNDSNYYGYPSKGILTIAQSDDANYDLKMTFFGGSYAEVTVYATVSDDGKSITTTAATSGPAFKVSTLSIEYLSMNGPIMGTVNFDTYEIYDYTASPK